MILARLLTVRLLPTTTNGKTDRRQLREQASSFSLEELAYFSTRSQHRRLPTISAEEVLLHVCAEVLGLPIENIGMDDYFFHFGGDLIIAIQFVS